MDIGGNVILIVSVLVIFVLGYFLMGRLDKFLDENREEIEKEDEKTEPSCVMLTEAMSEEEIAMEVRRFRKKHKETRIVLYDISDLELSESLEKNIKKEQ